MQKLKSYSITDKSAMIGSIKCCESQANMSFDNGVTEWTSHDKERLEDSVDMVDSTDQMKSKKGQNCQRPTTWQGSFHMFYKGETDWYPELQPCFEYSSSEITQWFTRFWYIQRLATPRCSKELKTTKSFQFLQKVNDQYSSWIK